MLHIQNIIGGEFMIRSRKWLILLLFPGLSGFILFWVYPVLSGIYFSTTNYLDGGKFVFLHNYKQLFANKVFLKALTNTFCITSAGVTLIMAGAFVIAYYIWKTYSLRRLLKVVILPLAVATVAVSFVWEALFNVNGDINKLLTGSLSLSPINWQSGILSYVPILLLYIWRYIGIDIIIFVSALNTVPQETSEAFLLDSKSNVKRIYYVLIPSVVPQTIFIFFISLMYCLWLSQDIFTIWKDYPPEQLYLLQHFITNSFRKLNYENASAASTVLIIIVGAILALLRKLERRYEAQ